MSGYYKYKYYEGNDRPWYREHRKVVSIRLSDEEINLVKKKYPCDDLFYGIRSLIHMYIK